MIQVLFFGSLSIGTDNKIDSTPNGVGQRFFISIPMTFLCFKQKNRGKPLLQ